MPWVIRKGAARENIEGLIGYIQGAVDYVKTKGLRIDRIFDKPHSCEDWAVQRELTSATRSLHSRLCAPGSLYSGAVDDSVLENVLNVLHETFQLFSNHPFSHVIYGRIVEISTVASREGLMVPERFSAYAGISLETWQSPTLDYTSPSDFKDRDDAERFLPPEWRG